MSRPLAFQETAGQVFEFSARCQQGRFLLTPGSEKNRRIVGVLARSLELYGDQVKVHLGGGTSNHLHLLVSAETSQAGVAALPNSALSTAPLLGWRRFG